MRDLGVFTSKPISSRELVEFVRAYARRVGQPFEKRSEESVVGTPPDVLYVFDATAVKHGFFSEEEKAVIESRLGSAPKGYVSIHFTASDAAAGLADEMAKEIGRVWNGTIDYSGAGGQLGVPPFGLRPASAPKAES